MSSFISSFRPILAAAAAIAIIEAAVYVTLRPTFVERSNYLDWNYASDERFHKLMIYEKLKDFADSAPDIIQVGDSSGFHGVNPDIVMQHLNGMTYVNLSCCANTGYDGYYSIAEFMFRRNPGIKALVLYVSLNNLPQLKLITGDEVAGGAERIRDSFVAPWAYLSPPSLALRRAVTDAVYSLGGLVRPRSEGLSQDDMVRDMTKSVRQHRGWWAEHDPRRAGQKFEDYWRRLCGDTGIRSSNDNARYYVRDLLLRRESFPLSTFGGFADLAARHGAKLAIVFHPYPCAGLTGNFLDARRAEIKSLETAHDNVIVLPDRMLEHWPMEEFTAASHLRTGYDTVDSHRVGRLLAAALGVTPAAANVREASSDPTAAAADSVPVADSATPSLWSSDRFDAGAWRADGVSMPSGATATDPSEAFQLTETTEDGFHRIETTIDGVSPEVPYVFSMIAKPVGQRALRIEMRDKTTAGRAGVVDCNMAALHANRQGDALDADMDVLPDGWYRCWGSMAFGGRAVVFGIDVMTEQQDGAYAGDGQSGLLLRAGRLQPGWRLRAEGTSAP